MPQSETVGTVAGIWRFPVKSLKGERIDRAETTERGLVGDRAYALIDSETGKVVSAKSVRHFPNLFDYRATYVEPPRAGQPLPPARISLPDGATVNSDSADVDHVLSASLGRDVTLAHAAPDDFTIDMYHPDLEDADPRGHRDTFVEQKLGAALFEEIGMDSPVARESFFDLFPLTVITTSTLSTLRDLRPDVDFDERRFRMNFTVDSTGEGFVENDWIGRALTVGGSALQIAMPDSRCVMTTLSQDELPRSSDVLKTLVQHNRLPIGDKGSFPCAGVYAMVASPGTVSVGDACTLA